MEENRDYKDIIIKDLKDLIKNDVSSGIDKPCTEYVNRAYNMLNRHYRFSQKHIIGMKLDPHYDSDINQLWLVLEPEVISAIERYLQEYRHKKLTKEIRVTSAKAVIKAAMKQAGLKYHFVGQTNRAKISVMITHDRMLTVYIPYKKLSDVLPQVIESIRTIRSEMESLGSNASINKAYHIPDWDE